MTEEALITTIICTYKRPQLLKRAIESALAQTFKNIKICVYDNDSGDETEAVVAEYSRVDKRVFYYKNSENIGAVNNMTQGVEKVNTEFYSLLNDDDFIFPDFYQNAMQEFEHHPDAGFVCSKAMQIDLNNKRMQIINKDWSYGLYQPSNEVATKMGGSHFSLTCILFRSSMKQKISPLIWDDNIYLIILSASSPFVVLDHCSGVNVIHSQSFTGSTGMVGADTCSLYQVLLFAIDMIMKLNIPENRKVHLLSMVTSRSFNSLAWKKREQLLAGSVGENQLIEVFLPVQITFSSFVIKLYDILPKALSSIISSLLCIILNVKDKLRKGVKGNWLPLSNDVVQFFLDQDTDVPKFVFHVRNILLETK